MRRVSTTVRFDGGRASHKWYLSTWERIEPKFKIDTASGCWLWTAALSHGYAVLGKPHVAVHRWMYQEFVGPIPEGLFIDHLCMVTNCINPAHLEPVTHAENQRRAAEALTHCVRGHPRTEENTYRSKSGRRACRPCTIEAQHRYQQRKSGKVA